MARESMVFYASFLKGIELLPTDTQKLQALLSILTLGLEEEDAPPDDDIARAIYEMAKPQVAANIKKAASGSNGGRPSKKTNGYENEKPMVSEKKNHRLSEEKTNGYENEKPNENENVNENANENVNVNANANELSAHVRERFGAFVENVEALTNSPMTEYKKQLVVQKLISLGKTEAEQIALLSEAIENGWHTVYPKKRTDAKRQETKEEFAERWACV